MNKYWGMTSSIASIVLAFFLLGCQGHRSPDRPVDQQFRGGSFTDVRHVVRYGDTLSQIVEHYNIPFATIVAANGLAPPYDIQEGASLRIPLGRAARVIWPSPRRPAGAPTFIKHAAGPIPSLDHAVDSASYVVGPGDNLAKIAARHSLPLGDLLSANAIRAPYRIYPGQSLIIPPSEEMIAKRAEALEEERRRREETVSAPPLSSDGFLWPVDGAVIRTFSQNTVAGQSGAINIAARFGTPVRATNHGIVAFVGQALDRFGTMIVLRHADGFVSLYAHNDKAFVQEGDEVRRGEVIADVGSSGDVTDSQLRFELRRGIEPIDPMQLLVGQPTRVYGAL